MKILIQRLSAYRARAAHAVLVCFFLTSSQVCGAEVGPVVLETKSGIPTWFLADTTTPVVNMMCTFQGSGSATDPADRAGRASMAVSLLLKGAGAFSAESLQEFMQKHGLGMLWNVSEDDAFFSINCLKRKLPEAKQAMQAVLYEPRFPRTEWKLLKQKAKAALAHEEDDPYAQASETFFRMQFKNHPYETANRMTPKSLKKLHLSDLKAYRQKCLVRSRLQVVVTGDLTPTQAADLVDEVFGAFPEGETIALPHAVLQQPGSITHIPADRPQTLVYFAQAGLEMKDPDFIAFSMLLDILGGGGMESRLGQEMREKKGLVYGVGVDSFPLEASPLLMGSFQTTNASLEEAVEVLRKEWSRMHQEGVTAQELENAKSLYIGRVLLNQTSSSAVARTLLAYQRGGRPIDYGSRRAQLIADVTLDQINAVAQRMLDPKTLTMVVVGPQALRG